MLAMSGIERGFTLLAESAAEPAKSEENYVIFEIFHLFPGIRASFHSQNVLIAEKTCQDKVKFISNLGRM